MKWLHALALACLFIGAAIGLEVITGNYGGDSTINVLVSSLIGGVGGLVCLEVLLS